MSHSGSFVERGRKMVRGSWGSLTVSTWGPERTETEILRTSHTFPDSHRDLSDESLQAVIDSAKAWIGGRRQSWSVVACNYLRDGRYHG